MYHPVCGMVHVKEPLLLIGKSNNELAIINKAKNII